MPPRPFGSKVPTTGDDVAKKIHRCSLAIEIEAAKWLDAWRDVIKSQAWTRARIADELNEKTKSVRGAFAFNSDTVRRFLRELNIELAESVKVDGLVRSGRLGSRGSGGPALLGELAKLQNEVSLLRRQVAVHADEAAQMRVLVRTLLHDFSSLLAELGREQISGALRDAVSRARLDS